MKKIILMSLVFMVSFGTYVSAQTTVESQSAKAKKVQHLDKTESSLAGHRSLQSGEKIIIGSDTDETIQKNIGIGDLWRIAEMMGSVVPWEYIREKQEEEIRKEAGKGSSGKGSSGKGGSGKGSGGKGK